MFNIKKGCIVKFKGAYRSLLYVVISSRKQKIRIENNFFTAVIDKDSFEILTDIFI